MFDLESNILSWGDRLRSKGKLKESDIKELESHLRDEIEDLIGAGLSSDEAFIISVKRMGNVNAISGEYAKINLSAFWKQLFIDDADGNAVKKNRNSMALAVLFSLLAGLTAKIPELFGYRIIDNGAFLFYLKNLSLFVLPFVALYFLITQNLKGKYFAAVLGIFGISAMAVNLSPILSPGDTAALTGIHLPIFLWLVVGVAYLGKSWRDSKSRMNFLRFTGEAGIYGGLIFMGILALGMFLTVIFSTIGIELSYFIPEYYLVFGGCAAAMIAVYLAEAKKSIVENFAPVLAKIFTPLFLISLLSFLVAMIATGKNPYSERDFLIGFDLMLVAVLGLVLYVISARKPHDPPNIFDYLNLALIVTALVIDFVALSAILYRLTEFGITPNKLAALGENLALMVNLGGLAVLYPAFFRKKIEFSLLERWQTSYLWVYALWTGVVAFGFPLFFGFR